MYARVLGLGRPVAPVATPVTTAVDTTAVPAQLLRRALTARSELQLLVHQRPLLEARIGRRCARQQQTPLSDRRTVALAATVLAARAAVVAALATTLASTALATTLASTAAAAGQQPRMPARQRQRRRVLGQRLPARAAPAATAVSVATTTLAVATATVSAATATVGAATCATPAHVATTLASTAAAAGQQPRMPARQRQRRRVLGQRLPARAAPAATAVSVATTTLAVATATVSAATATVGAATCATPARVATLPLLTQRPGQRQHHRRWSVVHCWTGRLPPSIPGVTVATTAPCDAATPANAASFALLAQWPGQRQHWGRAGVRCWTGRLPPASTPGAAVCTPAPHVATRATHAASIALLTVRPRKRRHRKQFLVSQWAG